MVGEALVVAAHQCQVDRDVNAVRPLGRKHRQQQRPVQMVHDVVVGFEFGCAIGVAAGDDIPALPTMSAATSPISRMVACNSFGTAQAGNFRRASFATCTARSPERSRSEVMRRPVVSARRSPATGCWRAMRSTVRRSTFSRMMSTAVVAVDHALGGAKVGVQQGLGGLRYRVADELGHLDELIRDRIKLVVIGVAHARSFRLLRRRRFAAPPRHQWAGNAAFSTAESFTCMDGGRRRGDSLQNGG